MRGYKGTRIEALQVISTFYKNGRTGIWTAKELESRGYKPWRHEIKHIVSMISAPSTSTTEAIQLLVLLDEILRLHPDLKKGCEGYGKIVEQRDQRVLYAYLVAIRRKICNDQKVLINADLSHFNNPQLEYLKQQVRIRCQ